MTKVDLLIQWFEGKKGGELTELTNIERINITKGKDSKVNSAEIFLKNPITSRNSSGDLFTEFVEPSSGEIRFKEGDTVKIYAARMEENRAISTATNSADLLMSAEVQEVNIKTEDNNTKLKLSCVDKSYQMFNVLWSSTYMSGGTVNTAPEIVQNVVRWASKLDLQNKQGYDASGNIVTPGLFGVDARLVTASGKIENTRQDSSSFPAVQLGKSFKPIYEWLDDLSSEEYTNDFAGSDTETSPAQNRKMVYYVDELNRFHWFYPKDGVDTELASAIAAATAMTGSGTITVDSTTGFDSSGRIQIGAELFDYTGTGATTFTGVTRAVNNTIAEAHAVDDGVTSALILKQGDITTGNIWLSSNFTKATFDIVNSVIYNAGDDMNGSGILGFWYDKTTSSPKLKMVYKAWTTIARRMKQDELNVGSQESKTTIIHTDGDEYAYPTDYTGYDADDPLPHWSPSLNIDSDGEFNTAFRTEATKRGESMARELTKQRGSERWKGQVVLQFRRFNAGNLIKVTSTISGINGVDLRIDKVQYNLSKAGNFVTLTLEEDEKKTGV